MNVKNLPVGTKIYSYYGFGKILDYNVIDKSITKHKILYTIKCNNCSDHGFCLVSIMARGDHLEFVEMLNNEDEEYAHSTGFYGGVRKFFLSVEETEKDNCKDAIENQKKEIDATKSKLNSEIKYLKELELYLLEKK